MKLASARIAKEVYILNPPEKNTSKQKNTAAFSPFLEGCHREERRQARKLHKPKECGGMRTQLDSRNGPASSQKDERAVKDGRGVHCEFLQKVPPHPVPVKP